MSANHLLLDKAVALPKEFHWPSTAVLIWDGVSRGDHDLTEEFGAEARKRGPAVVEVRTI